MNPSTGANKNGIASRNFNTGLPLPGFKIFDIDWRTGFEVRHILQPRNIHQDAARKYAILCLMHRGFGRSALHRDIFLLREAVVHLSAEEVMRERIKMRMCESMESNRYSIRCR